MHKFVSSILVSNQLSHLREPDLEAPLSVAPRRGIRSTTLHFTSTLNIIKAIFIAGMTMERRVVKIM